MSYTAAEGRQQILDALADAADQLAVALAELSEAYERLDEHAGERLEEALFGPVQTAYGRSKRTHKAFAERSQLSARPFETPSQVAPSHSARASIERAIEQAAKAEETLAELQDSMLPVEVGDDDLRASLADIRRLLAPVPSRGRELLRTLGR